MKTSTSPNRKTGRMIAKNLIILLVVTVVAFVSMWAWFTDHQVAEANGIDVNCQMPDGIEIAVVAPGVTPTDEDYVEDGIIIKDQKFLKDLVMSEVTSDGVTFYKPVLSQSNGVAKPDLDSKWDLAELNKSYLAFDLYVRSKTSYTLSLAPGSKVTPVSTVLAGEDAGNKSTDGNFSRDCIVGATRLSFVDSEDVCKLLWIPRPDIYFSSVGQGSASVELDVAKSAHDGVTYQHSYYEVTEDLKTLKTMGESQVVASKKVDGEYVLGDKAELVTMAHIGDDHFYTEKIRCNMWIDGEDTEDRLALVKGKFSVFLDFTIK